MAQQDDNIKKLYDELQSTYDLGSEDDFRNYLNNAEHRKALYNELKNDYDIQDEKAFDDYLGYGNKGKAQGTTKVGSAAQQVVNEYDQSVRDNANNNNQSAPEDLSAATAGAKIGGNISLTPARPNNQQTAQPAVDNTSKSVMDANGKHVEQAKATGPKTQFVPADPNYVQATPTTESLKKYPWMQPDQVYLWNKTTKEPVVSYFDENGQAVTDEDLQIKKAKSEITGQEDTEYMHPEAAALQLPNGNTRGVRLKKGALTQMADEIMRKEYGDNYLNTQFGRDGNVYTGAERRDLGAQQLYDELNSDVRKARISFAVADDKGRSEILSRIKAKWGKVADENSLVNAVNDENAAKEDIDIVAQQNINDLNAEIQNISRQMDQRGAEIDNASSPFVDQTFNARDVDAKYRLLQSKLNYAQNALKSWQNVKNSGSLDALAGFKDAVMDISAWDFGFSDLKNAVSLLTAKGKDKQELVNLYGRSAEAAKFEDKYNPDSYRYGKIAGASIPFALQFVGTGGGFKSIGSAVSKKTTSIAEKYALEGLKKQVVKGLGVAVGDIARAYTMSGTVQGLNTISDILTRSAGELTVDKQGNYQLKSDEPLLKSIYKGVTASAIENYTEMLGERLNIGGNLMRMLPKIGLGRVSNAITKIGTQDWYKVCNNWLSRAGVNDFGGEVLEEEIGIVLNAALVGDNPLLNGNGGLLDVRTQKDILGGMLYSISAMRAGALAMYGVKKGVGSAFVKTLDMYDKMQLNQSDKGGQSIFGEGWTEIKDEIDNTPNDKVNAVIEKLAKEHPSKDEQSAIIDYAVKLLKTRGHNLGIAMASDGENDEGAQEEVQDMPDLSQPNAEYFNKDDGMIHKASLYPDASDPTGTAKDVFIIKGNLVTNEDGSINKDASDDTIIYIDGNGERHIASPDKFAAAYPPMSNDEVQQANEGVTGEGTQTTDTFNKGDEVNINVNGIIYTATIQGTDGSGNYNVYYEDENGMMHPAKFTADQLNEMNGKSTVSNGQQATSEQPADVQQQVEQPVVEQSAQQEQETQLAQQAQEEQKPAIPKDEKGNTLYHQVPVETTIKDLYDGKLDDNEIRDFVDVNISEADKNLEKVNKKAPKIGTNKDEYLKKKQEWQKQVEDATRIRDYWNSVKNYIAQQTHTTPEEVKAAQDEISGEAARREYQDMGGSVQQDAVSVASDFIRGAKITPESFKAETGYGAEEQRKFVGMIAKAENGGKSIDRLAEELVSYDNAEMNGSLFGGDTSSAKDAILSALQGAGTRGELKQTNEAEEQAYVDARNAARDAQYMEQYGMTYEEYLAYEEQIMPTIWREYNNYDETAFNNMYAEEIEQLLKSKENDTTGEKQADDRGNQVLSEQQVTEQRGSTGSQEQRTEAPVGVQGNNENAVAPEEASGERIPNIERGRQGYTGYIARRQQNNLETSEEINVPLSQNEQDEYGNPMVLAENGSTVFGTIESESGLTEAPIKLSLGENKVGTDGKNHGYGLLHIEAGHGEQIRNAGYQSVEQFVENVAQNYTDIKEGALIGKKQTYLLEVSDEHNNTLFIQLSNDGTYWNVNSAGIFKKKYSRRKPLIYTVPAVGKSTVTDTSEVNSGQSMGATAPAGNSSESKDTESLPNEQTINDKINISESNDNQRAERIDKESKPKVTQNNSEKAIGERLWRYVDFLNNQYGYNFEHEETFAKWIVKKKNNIKWLKDKFPPNIVREVISTINDYIKLSTKPSISSKIANAEAETDTNPTEGQKEAGNYKKGHVRIDGYDITIEQPKGSVRRGTDADGKQWEQTMNNTYGYIRGTEGVDGDHIDIFLSDNPTEGNVYVVDQVNPDGSFDEHKVMYGFNSADEARNAYLSNYEEGWQGLGTITEISKDEFKKWVNSSHRKTKPFAEYKSVKEDNNNIRFRETNNEVSVFALKHNLNEKDVEDYADYIRRGNLNGASRAFKEIRRKVRLDNQGASLGQFAKIFSPIEKELYERFGNIDELRQQYVQRTLDERNAMEAARKKAEEEAEAERRRLQEFQNMSSEQLDAEYMKAVEANDESRMRDLVNEAARRNGYGDTGSEYQGVGAWSAPSNPGYESDEERRAAVENDAPDVNITDIANGYSQQPSDYFTNLRAYGTDTAHGRESAEAINKAIDEVRNGKDPMVKVYRAVPKSVKEGKLRNGDWVTPSRKYAEMHGDNRLEGDYRIIEQEVPASQLWWDGNDINEWGFDDGKGYAYRNTKNNRKLNDLITRDDKGNIIPLSQRFNARKADVRYRNTENQAATDNIEDVNKQFNQQLEGLTEENADKVTLSLGRPSAVLRAAGVEDKPMKLYGNKVIKKMRKHGFTLAEIKDLPRAVADPIAVFNNYQKNGNRSILTELQIGDKHILVSVTVGKTGVDADFNIVSSVFGKGSNNVVDWINKGYATFINKEKALDYLHFSERSISEASDNQELVSTANIIRNFENPNVLEENLVPTEQTNDIDTAVADTANKLNIGVRVAHSVDEVSDEGVRRAIEQGRRIQGFYDTRTGEIVVYAPNAVDAEDAVRTVLHEGVAHYGLRQLVGEENFNTFLDNIYNNVSDEIKSKVDDIARKNKLSTQVATEEYLAGLAEKTNFEEVKNSGIWDKIKDFFMDLLTKAGIRLNNALSDNELRYILWRSYDNLQNPTRDVINTVRDITKQRDLNVGNYSVQNSRNNVAEGSDNVLYREAKEVEEEINNDWRDEYDKKLSTLSFKLTEAAQDAMRSVKILQDIIAKETSAPISDDENVYWRENRLSSVNKYEQEYYNENYFKPIVTAIANLVKYGARYNDKGKDIINSDNDILKYLIAKHGIERNNYFREREAMNARKPYEDQIKELQKQVEKGEIKEEDANKKIAKLQEQADKAEMKKRVDVLHKDYSGLTELFQDKKDFDTLASSYVSDFEKKFDTEPLWDAINRATKGTLRKAFVDGLISRESYENTAKMYEYYIPLRGWANDVASEKYNYIGGKGHSSKILEISHGRTSLADNPISEIGRMMQDAIFQGNRNRMKQAVYNLAMNHDTSLLNIKRQWYQNMGTKDDPIWERVFPDLNSDMTAEQVAEEVEDFESRMRELKKEGKATQSRKGLILRLHTTKREETQHRISVAINGKEYNIFVNGNPRAAQAINGELNDVDRYESYISKINRFLSQVYTSVNPEFVVTNYQRDAGFAASIVASTEPWSYQKEWAKNMTKYNPITTGVYLNSLIKKAKTGNINTNNKAERYMQEFLSNGGETGFTNMLSADDYKKQIKRDIKSINSVVSLPKAARAAVAFTERANTVFEDATRYATYVTSREQGRTIDRSIRDAKEISLNFNTRGADGLPGDGFIYRFFRGLRRWMIFVNPSIQGLNKAGMAFRNHPLRSSMMIAGLPTLLGYALPAIMQAVVGGGDGDDDDKNVVESYKDLPKWVRRTNIAIPIGGNNFVTIPLSYELRVSYGLGEMIWEYGEGMIDKEEVAVETLSQLSDLLPVSFSNGTVAQSISPSIARPLIDIIQNRNFYGKKIYNDSQFIEGYPEYMKAYAGTPKWLVKSTEVLNSVIPNLNAGVSDKYTPGAINVNPAIIDYLLSSYLGGLYNFPSKFGKTISMIWDEDMRDIQNVPILSRNWKNSQSGNPYNSGDRYKTYMKEYDLSKQRFNGYKKEAKNDVPEFLNSLKDLLNTPSGKRMLMIDAYKRGGLDKLNQRIRDIDAYDNERYEGEKDALTKKRDEVKEELINKLDSISDGTLDFVNGEWIRK